MRLGLEASAERKEADNVAPCCCGSTAGHRAGAAYDAAAS